MGLYTHKLTSHHDTIVLYYTLSIPCQVTNCTISSISHIWSLILDAIAGVLGYGLANDLCGLTNERNPRF
jgi:hypothetical protein